MMANNKNTENKVNKANKVVLEEFFLNRYTEWLNYKSIDVLLKNMGWQRRNFKFDIEDVVKKSMCPKIVCIYMYKKKELNELKRLEIARTLNKIKEKKEIYRILLNLESAKIEVIDWEFQLNGIFLNLKCRVIDKFNEFMEYGK